MMKIINLDSNNFRLHSNSVDGRGLSAQDIRGKLGLNNATFSVSKVGENNTNNKPNTPVISKRNTAEPADKVDLSVNAKNASQSAEAAKSVTDTNTIMAPSASESQRSANMQMGSSSITWHSGRSSVSSHKSIQADGSYRAFEWQGQESFRFTTVEGSYLRNIQDGSVNAMDSYYKQLFQTTTENVNAMLDEGLFGVATVGGWHANTVDRSIARYEELRDEVHKAFGHDSNLLAANLKALDNAFEGNLQSIATHAAIQMDWDRMMTENSATRTNPHEPHALANNKNFNSKEFERNSREMMSQFSRYYLEQVNGGIKYNDALKAATDFINSIFGLTASVNKLSFKDFLYLIENITQEGTSTAPGDQHKERNMFNLAFNNSTQLSPELRALLNA